MEIGAELTPEERQAVKERLLAEQRSRFGGQKKAAYTAAGVNAATWNNAIAGTRVRPDRLVRIVAALWPETGGDWTLVPPAGDWTSDEMPRQVGDDSREMPVSDYVLTPIEREVDDAEIAFEKAITALVNAEATLDGLMQRLAFRYELRNSMGIAISEWTEREGRPPSMDERKEILRTVSRPTPQGVAEMRAAIAEHDPREWTRFEMALFEYINPDLLRGDVTSNSRYADLEPFRVRVRRMAPAKTTAVATDPKWGSPPPEQADASSDLGQGSQDETEEQRLLREARGRAGMDSPEPRTPPSGTTRNGSKAGGVE